MIPNFEDYKPMIYELAQKKRLKTRVELDDLLGRGGMIFAEALRKFNPAKGVKFSTFLYLLLDKQLIPKEPRFSEDYYFAAEEYAKGYDDPAKIVEFWDTLSCLSNEAKEVIWMVVSCPDEIVSGAINKPKLMAGNLRRKLVKQGWRPMEIWDVFNEIKQILR